MCKLQLGADAPHIGDMLQAKEPTCREERVEFGRIHYDMKVWMFAFTPCDEHYIVQRKPARTLVDAGYDVSIIAVLGKDMPAYEESDGFRIFRVSVDPSHLKVLFKVLRLAGLAKGRIQGVLGRRHGVSVTKPFDTGEEGQASGGHSPLGWQRSAVYRALRSLFGKIYGISIGHRYWCYLQYYYRSYLLAGREPADLYHAHDLPTLPVAWICSRRSGGKVIYDSHELWLDVRYPPRSKLSLFLVKRIESFLVRRTDANIMGGLSSSNELSRRYSIPAPTVILNVPDYQPFEYSTVLRDKLGIPKEQRIMLYMGVISSHKGIEEGIRSLKYLSGCCLVIFGFGHEGYIAGLKELIQDEDLGKRVFFFPAVPFDEVTRHAMSADVGLVLHQNINLNYYYVSPNKLFESMVAGLPVVGSNFPDLKTFIEGYRFGATCDPTSPKEIASAVDYILSDRSRYEEMRQNALEAAKIFNWENESKKLLALYEGLGPPAANRLG